MKVAIQSYLDGLLLARRHPNALWLFEKLVFAWFIATAVVLLQAPDFIWGRDGISLEPIQDPSLFNNLIFFLVYNGGYAKLILYIYLASAIWAFWGRFAFVPKLLVYLISLQLFLSAHVAFNGSFYLMYMYAFFLLLNWTAVKHPLLNLTSNLSFYACRMQLVVVYASAAAFKLTGTQWLDGSAIYYALNYHADGGIIPTSWILGSDAVVIFSTYLGLIYQIAFPLLVWFKKVKRWLLWVGMGFHFFIGAVMGLWGFAFAMVAGYVLFLEEERIEQFRRFIRL